jgi:hypothetical protein
MRVCHSNTNTLGNVTPRPLLQEITISSLHLSTSSTKPLSSFSQYSFLYTATMLSVYTPLLLLLTTTTTALAVPASRPKTHLYVCTDTPWSGACMNFELEVSQCCTCRVPSTPQ